MRTCRSPEGKSELGNELHRQATNSRKSNQNINYDFFKEEQPNKKRENLF